MAQQWFVAQDTFNAELPDGGSVTVQKGSTWPAGHHAVRLDAGRGVLFKPQDPGPEEVPVKRLPGRPRKAAAEVPAGDGDEG
jgi:hypothetical protein